MAKPFLAFAAREWLQSEAVLKQVRRGRVPLGLAPGTLNDKASLFVRYRSSGGEVETDAGSPEAVQHGNDLLISSETLLKAVSDGSGDYLVAYFEGSKTFARCLLQWWSKEDFDDLDAKLTLRLDTYDLPPASVAVVDYSNIVGAVRTRIVTSDPDLFNVQAAQFLDGPHVLERLLDHLMELRAIEAPNFITVTKGLSDQFRSLLQDEKSPIRIRQVTHSHLHLWASMQGQPTAFIDGGVARLNGYPGIEQFAMRVGIYRVVPGETDPTTREQWSMFSRVLADVVDTNQASDGPPDRKRLQEALRYTLEALVLMRCLEGSDPPAFAFSHGPLVNQFVTYDEGEPYWMPDLLPEFLAEFGLTQPVITSSVKDIPHDPAGRIMWNQFMAVYAVIIRTILASSTPAVGVVERGVGRPLTLAVLDTIKDRHLVDEKFAKRFQSLLTHYGITDDLLFGCVLKQGEYITPVTVKKNPVNRARDRWQPVVKQFGNPRATLLKPQDGTFPLRLEMNSAAADRSEEVISLAYHTARLLPRYAFPVGLDIVDKFAKVPDWMTKAVSTAGAAALLRRAVEEADDPAFISAVRRELAGQPRDFFFRPSVK